MLGEPGSFLTKILGGAPADRELQGQVSKGMVN
jgi:hypothetical protein